MADYMLVFLLQQPLSLFSLLQQNLLLNNTVFRDGFSGFVSTQTFLETGRKKRSDIDSSDFMWTDPDSVHMVLV